MGAIFKVYIADGQEYFIYQKNGKQVKASFHFSQSLLDLLYLDMDAYNDTFDEIYKAANRIYTEWDDRLAQRIKEITGELARVHIYFEFLYHGWNEQLEALHNKDNVRIMDLLPQRKKLQQLPDAIRTVQVQLGTLFEQVLDITSPAKPISEKMFKYQNPKEGEEETVFRFGAQIMHFEAVDKKAFCEVLYANNMFELIDYFVRECIKREQRFRMCKNCDRYFALTGYINAEYCDRTYDEQGHTCKEMGALNVWQKKAKKPAYELYSKEYKKRFARIKYGKLTKEDFCAWAEKAREMRNKCMAGELEYEKFQEWIAEN